MHRKLINTNVKGYAKDPITGVVYNTDYAELDRIVEKRQAILKEQENKQVVQNLQKEVSNLKDDISDVKSMLRKLLER